MKAIEVEIYGHRYTLQGEADEAYIQELASYVEGQMRTLAQNMKTSTPTKLAVLSAINITHQLFQEERARQTTEAEVERRADGMLASIDPLLS